MFFLFRSATALASIALLCLTLGLGAISSAEAATLSVAQPDLSATLSVAQPDLSATQTAPAVIQPAPGPYSSAGSVLMSVLSSPAAAIWTGGQSLAAQSDVEEYGTSVVKGVVSILTYIVAALYLLIALLAAVQTLSEASARKSQSTLMTLGGCLVSLFWLPALLIFVVAAQVRKQGDSGKPKDGAALAPRLQD